MTNSQIPLRGILFEWQLIRNELAVLWLVNINSAAGDVDSQNYRKTLMVELTKIKIVASSTLQQKPSKVKKIIHNISLVCFLMRFSGFEKRFGK